MLGHISEAVESEMKDMNLPFMILVHGTGKIHYQVSIYGSPMHPGL